MRSKRSMMVWLVVLLLAVPALVHAQEHGRLIGKVIDEKGDPVEGVTVVTTSTAVPDFRDVQTTDKRGVFTVDFPQIEVVYRLRFDKVGFAPLQSELTWNLAGTARQEFTLHPEGMVELGTAPVASTSNEAIAAYNAAVEAFKAKDYATAETKLKEAIQHDPKLGQAWALLSITTYEQGNFKDSAEDAEKAIALGVKDDTLLRTRWEDYRQLGDDAKAAAAMEDIKKSENRVAEAKSLHNEAVELLKKGDAEGALAKFQAAVELDPTLLPALNGVATTALKLGKNKEAAAAAEKVLAVDPHSEEALRVRYNAYLALGDQDKLVEALVGLNAVDPKVAQNGLLKMAFDAYDANDMPKARDRFLKFLQLDPDNTTALYYLATVEVNMGENDAAKKHLEHFLQLAPSDKEASTARAMLDYLNKH